MIIKKNYDLSRKTLVLMTVMLFIASAFFPDIGSQIIHLNPLSIDQPNQTPTVVPEERNDIATDSKTNIIETKEISNNPAAPLDRGDDPWWNTNWSCRKMITIDYTKVTGNLANFPVVVNLTDNDLKTKALSNGYDIVFTNKTGTKLNHEIERYRNSDGRLVAWVNVTALSNTANTILYMYYNNTISGNQQNPSGVWDSNYVMVQHLEESSGIITDSTSFHNNGTEYVSPDTNMNVSGKIDGAIDFDGTDDYVTFGQPSSLNFQPNIHVFTVSFWVKTTDTSGAFLSKAGTASTRQYHLYTDPAANGLAAVIGGTQLITNRQVNNGIWHHIVGVNYNDAGTRRFRYYIDGTADSAVIASGATTNSFDVLIGARRGSSNSDYAANLDGMLDEVRVSNIARNAAWIATEYNNQVNPSLFYTVGPEIPKPGPNPPPVVTNPSPAQGASGVSLNPALTITVGDSDTMNVWFSTNATGSWAVIGSNLSVGNGTYRQIPTVMNNYNTKYYWSVNVTDGTQWTNTTYWFKTEIAPGLWWNTDWLYRKSIVINHAQIAANLVNFPVLISFSADADLASYAQVDDDDIVFTDYNGNKLNHEIERYGNAVGNLVCWVNVTTLPNTEDTILYMYYGNPSCGNQQNPLGVWDSNYVMVQHLEESSGVIIDSTLFHNNGTEYVSPDANLNASGKIDGAIDFDGADDYVDVGSDVSLDDITNLTVDAWIYLEGWGQSNYGRVLQKSTVADILSGWGIWVDGSAGNINFLRGWTTTYGQWLTPSGSLSLDNWYHVVVVYKSSSVSNDPIVYINGISQTITEFSAPAGAFESDNNANLWIGRRQDGNRAFNGIIDEVRISKISRDNSWIKTEYNNQLTPSAFYNIGNKEQTEAPRISNPNPPNNANNIPVNLPELNFTLIDYENDLMNYTITTNPDIIGGTQIGNSIANGTTIHIPITSGPLLYGSTYLWRVNVTDGKHWSNMTLQFTTISQAPHITNIFPADGSINIPISLSEIRFTLIDYQNDKMNYTITANPDIIGGIQTGNNITNTTTIHIPITSILYYGTTYQWRINCTDGKEWTNKSYTFTTKISLDLPLKWTINTGGWEERGLRLADINGDGAKEIFFHSAKIDGTSPLFIRAYNGTDGSEIWSYYDNNISDIYGPGRMEVVDLNNDDIPEVVFNTVDHSRPSNQNRCGMVALHGNNGTIYWKLSGLDGPDSAGNPVIFDLDLDGYPTIFTATRNYGGTTQPAIYSISYDGNINCKNNLLNIVCAGGLSIMDYNNDGHFEVYAGDWYDPGQDPTHPEAYGVVRAYYAENLTNIWSSALHGNPDYILGPAAMIPILADANGDGIREVITQVYQNGSGHPRIGFAVLSAKDGEILDIYILRGSAGTQEPAVYDIDNDGHNELIMVGHEESPRSFTVFDLITKTIDFQTGVNSGSWMHPTIADVTGDGNMEILVPDSNRILIYNKTYSMIKQLNLVVGGEFTSIFIDDVDGDDLVEIVVSATTHIQVFDTDAPVPTGGIRSGLERFSEYRTGVAEYVSILGLKEEYPPRNTVGVSLNPTLSVNVTNYQYELMDITFRTNASGIWQDITSYTNVGNNRYIATSTNMNTKGKTYYWSVNATDRINTWTNMTYKFTTFTDYPVLSSVYPGNNSVGIPLNPTLSVFVEDQQSDELSVSFMTNKSGSWQQIGSTQTGYNNTYIQSTTMFNTFNTKYWWSVNSSDDAGHWTNKTFCFTTGGNTPPIVSDIYPADNAMMVPISLAELSFNISDVDGQTMDYELSTIPDIGSGSDNDVSNGRYSVSISGLTYNTTYIWYVNVFDGIDWTNKTFSFTTRIHFASWWNSSWLYRKEIIIDHKKVAVNLTNFPILIKQIDVDLAGHAQVDGDDIVFTDYNGNKLNHEIEMFNDTSGELVCWVKVTTLSSTEDTILYMYYGNPSCGNQQNPLGVWDSNYVMVQHLEESSGVIIDSTLFHNNGTEYVSPDANLNVSGKIDGAIDFDGTDDYVTFGQPSSLNFQPNIDVFTVSFWVKTTDTSGAFFSKAGTASTRQYHFYTDTVANGLAAVIGGTQLQTNKQVNNGIWHHIVGVNYNDAGTRRFRYYIDGTADSTIIISGATTNSFDVLIGARRGSSNSDYAANLDGMLDEVHVSNIARSGGWISTEYNNQVNPSLFYTMGNEVMYQPEEPILSDETPVNNALGIPVGIVTLRISINDYQNNNMNVTFRTNASGSTWSDIGSNTSVPNGTYSQNYLYNDYGRKYWWSVNCSDGQSWTNKTYMFTTINASSQIVWDVLLNVSGPESTNDSVVFGEASDSSDGQDGYDVPKPMAPPAPFVYAWFDANLSEPYNLLLKDYRSYPDTTKIWDLYVRWEDTGSASITIRWDPDSLNGSEYVVVMLEDIDEGVSTDMLLHNSYTYVASATTTRHFQITCNITSVEYYYRVPLKEEWNLISLPVNQSISKNDITANYLGLNYTWQEAVSAHIVLGFIYGWNATYQNYELTDVLCPGQGYWMYTYHDCDLIVSGIGNNDSFITLLQQNWNIMGLPYNISVAKENLIINYSGVDYTWQQAIDNDIILGFVYDWDRNTQNYILSDDLDPGFGYWMYAFHDCILKKEVN